MNSLSFALGVTVCLMAWFLPLHHLGVGMFSAHMITHMALVAVAAPFMAIGLKDLFPKINIPVLLATLLEFCVVWAWHIPALHNLARTSDVFLMIEQASFLLVGIIVWASVLTVAGRLAGAGGLLLTSMHMTLLGTIITLAPRILYQHGNAGSLHLWDQQLGGMIMLAVGTPVYLIAGLFLVYRELNVDRKAERSLT